MSGNDNQPLIDFLYLEPGNRNQSIAMLLSQGVIVMRILSKKELKGLVLYSPQHIARLEKDAVMGLSANRTCFACLSA